MKDPKDNKTVDAFAKVTMTAAERKRKQRANMSDRIRLDCYISSESKAKLAIIREFGVADRKTDTATIEWIINQCFIYLGMHENDATNYEVLTREEMAWFKDDQDTEDD